MANNLIHFVKGTQANYDLLKPTTDTSNNPKRDVDTVYVCTDTQRVFIGDKEYTRPLIVGSKNPNNNSPTDPNPTYPSSYPLHSLYFNDDPTTGGVLYYTDGTDWNEIFNLTEIADALNHRFDDQTPQPARTVLAAPGASGVTNLYPGTAQSGYYISDSGVVTADSSLCYSEPLDVAYGDIIYVEGVHHNASVSGNKSLHGYSGSGTDSWVSRLYRTNVLGNPSPYGFYVIINNQSITKVRLVYGVTDTDVCIYTNASTGAPSFRKLTLLDLPNFNVGNGISLNRPGDQSSLTITVNQQLLNIPTSATYYYPLFSSSTTNNNGGIYKSDTYQIRLRKGTTGQNGYAQLKLGNNIGSGSNNNSEGYITLYSTGTNAVYICASSGSTSPSYYFPVNNISGSRYVANIASNTAVGSSLKPVYVASNGEVTVCDFAPTTQFNVGKLLYQEGNQNNNSSDVRASEAFTIMHTFWGGDAPALGKLEGDLSQVTVSLGAGNRVEGRLEVYPIPTSTNNTIPAIIASDIGTTVTSTSAMYHFWADGKSFGTNNEKRTMVSIKRNTATGSATTPVYIDQYGAVTAGSAYAGATAVTLNGTSAAAGTASFYAPTSVGSVYQFLQSNGSDAPTWGTFTAGNGINLTSASTGLTIAAKTVLKNPAIFTAVRSIPYTLGISDATDNSGNLYKTSSIMAFLTDSPTSPSARLVVGGADVDGLLTIANNDGINHATLAVESNRSNATTYYLPDYNGSRYLAHVGSISSTTGNSGMPVYVSTNGEITSCIKSNLQANIFVISDTAPTDTSVIWLKPVSSTT